MNSQERSGWDKKLIALLASICIALSADQVMAQDSEALRKQFAEVQKAVQSKDAGKLWELLGSKSQGDAEKIAREIRETFAKGTAEEKRKQAETLGLDAKDLNQLTGKAYLMSAPVWRKLKELPESKIARIVLTGDNATLHYLETDGDKEKMIFVRQGNDWKAWLILPRPVNTKVLAVPGGKGK
jgi:hypothetical protein